MKDAHIILCSSNVSSGVRYVCVESGSVILLSAMYGMNVCLIAALCVICIVYSCVNLFICLFLLSHLIDPV